MAMKRKLLKRFVTYPILVAALAVAVLAQQPSSTPSVDRLRQVIEYLASDALEGRRTGTPGANDAAHYIAGEFNRYGLRPGIQMARPARTRGEDLARYLQPFPYVGAIELGKGNQLGSGYDPSATKSRMFALLTRVGVDWMPLGFSSNGRIVDTPAVFVGYGITASDLKYDDYAGVDAKGRVVFAFEGTPDGDNPHGQFARFEDARFKAIAAREHGAKALLIIARELDFKEDRLSRLRYDNAAGEAGLLVAAISPQTATPFFSLSSPNELVNLENDVRRISKMRAAPSPGYDPTKESFAIYNPKPTVSLSVDLARRESPSFNVVGILPGSDPKLKDEVIVIGAHYDHLGRGGPESLAPREGDIHHGADDNASGVAGLIELARMLSTQNPKPRRTVVFIAFSGEEEGLIGSSYYVNHPVVPLANTVAMINMDMIGRLKDQNLIVGGVGTAQEWRPMVEAHNTPESMRTAALNDALSARMSSSPNLRVSVDPAKAPSPGVPIVVAANGQSVVTAEIPKLPSPNLATPFALTLNEDGYGPSDHSSFYAKQIPVLFFWTGNHEDYHKPSDTADKINYEGEARVVSFVVRVVRDIDQSDKRPTYTVAKSESQGRTMGFRVYLGTIPNYADSNDGLKLDGVRDDSPASKAGLKAGDKIVKMAGREVKNVYDYTYALGEMKAGQQYEVEIVRGSERLTFKIIPAARK